MKWREKLNLKTEKESWLTVLSCGRSNNVDCKKPFQHTWHVHAVFPKGGKTKTKMDDLRQDSQTGLLTEYFALCSEHFEASCFSRSVLIGTPVGQYTRCRKIHWTLITKEMREDLQIDFFPRNVLLTFLWDPLLPYQETSASKIPLTPPQ